MGSGPDFEHVKCEVPIRRLTLQISVRERLDLDTGLRESLGV